MPNELLHEDDLGILAAQESRPATGHAHLSELQHCGPLPVLEAIASSISFDLLLGAVQGQVVFGVRPVLFSIVELPGIAGSRRSTGCECFHRLASIGFALQAEPAPEVEVK